MDGCLFRALALFFLLPVLAKADAVNSEWYSTTRARSTGNVGIASAEEPAAAAFFNPAALARTKKPGFEVLNPQVEVGGGVFSLSSSYGDWGKHMDFGKVEPLLRAKPGTPSSMGYALFPNVSSQNFSFGALLSAETASYYDSRTDSYHHHSRKLFIPSFGLSAGLLGSRLRLGLAVRGVQNYESNVVTQGTAATVPAVYDIRGGFGIGFDSGILYTFPWSSLPTIGFVARNIGDTTFPSAVILPLGGSSNKRHEPVKMTFDSGISFTPRFGGKNQLTFATDYRDLMNSSQTGLMRKLNIGLEYSAKNILFFRLGFSQGYVTGGIGLNSKVGSLDLGTYAEELDPHGFHGFQDRRYSLRFTRRF